MHVNLQRLMAWINAMRTLCLLDAFEYVIDRRPGSVRAKIDIPGIAVLYVEHDGSMDLIIQGKLIKNLKMHELCAYILPYAPDSPISNAENTVEFD